MSFSCYSTKTVYSPLRLLSRPEIIQCYLCKQNDHTERCETKTLSDHWTKIFFLSDFHCASAFSCSDRVVFHSRQRCRSWNFWKRGLIIDLRPHSDPAGGLPRSGGFNWPLLGTKQTLSEEGPGGVGFVWRLFACGKWWKLLKQKGVKNK